ncbi:MAG TPA: hypothetical protein PL087_10430, partial [Bacteroidales bacterium]|nr:hypothetical protein [Bacteroidales bacterium]
AQLTEFMTGMDTRIGYPNEHLASEIPPEMTSPMHATGIGLVIEGIGRFEKEMEKMKPETPSAEPSTDSSEEKKKRQKEKKTRDTTRFKGFPDRFLDKIRNIFEEDVE